MGSGISSPSPTPVPATKSHKTSQKYLIDSQHSHARLLTPNNIRRAKRGSFLMPKVSSVHFTAEMVGDYIQKLSSWNEGFGYEGKDFMNHMKFLNYSSKLIENEIDGSYILTLKTQHQIDGLFDELEIHDQQHRQIIQLALNDLQSHLLQSIHVIRYSDFLSLKEFPRCPDNNNLIHDLIDIDLSKSFIIFISHCWLRGYPGAVGYTNRPHPDNAENEKYQLCCEGITKILQNLTDTSPSSPNAPLECYIWMDYSCIHQDSNPAGELQHLDDIIKYSDCLFTPIVDENPLWEYLHSNEGDCFSDYKATGWCIGEHSYIQRAWCRIEMFYAANVPLSKHVKTKLPLMKHGLKTALEHSRRPHFLYGTRESRLTLNPIQLQPLCKEYSFFDKYHPCKGSVTMQSDLMKIQQLVDELKPYLPYQPPLSSVFPSPLVTSRKLPSNLIPHSQTSTRHHTPEKKKTTLPLAICDPIEMSSHSSLTSSPSVSSSLRKRNSNSPLNPMKRLSSSSIKSTRSSPMLSPIAVTNFNGTARSDPEGQGEVHHRPLVKKSVSSVTPFVLDSIETLTSSIPRQADEDDELSACNSLSSIDNEEEEIGLGTSVVSSKQLVPLQQAPSPPRHQHESNAHNSHLATLNLEPMKIPTSSRRTRDINGCVYHGSYKGNDRHGIGQLQYPNGDIFEGIFKSNVIHGKGKYSYGNGDVFVGSWKNGYRHGKGVHTVSDGEVIEELYRNGHKITGQFMFPEYVFIGSLNRDGMKEGAHCVVRYHNGDVYEGKYVNDQREGSGRYCYANGDVYEGQYHHHLRHGKGKYKTSLGDLFTGEYKYDKKDCDSGTYITAKGDVFHGQWKNNLKHGKFKIKYQNGESYVGDYRNNKKHGRGVYVYANTESYTGEYRDGKKHGQGIYRFKNGTEKRGLWSEDTLIENPLSGHGKSILSRGISMRSICNEQNEKEDDEQSLLSSSSSPFMNSISGATSPSLVGVGTPPSNRILLSRGDLTNRNPSHSNSPQRSRKTTTPSSSPYRTPSPNRARSCSDGSDSSSALVTIQRPRHQSPLRRTARL